MNIRKSTWHYRFIMIHTTPPKNLCSYFWTLVSFMVVWFLLWWLFVLAFVVIRISDWLESGADKKPKVTKIPKEPGLIRSWVSAKKNKVCPLIEFVEGDNNGS